MKLAILLTLLCSEVFAAGGSGHGSPSDLIPSVVNIAILLSGLVFLLKGKLSSFFTDKSVVIAEMMERAEIKAKEAQMMMDMQKKKIEGAQAEIAELKKDTEKQIAAFESEYKKEVDERIQNMKEDAGSKIEAEKTNLLNELNSNLLDQVIVKAKQKIKSEQSLKSKATESLIGEL